MDRQGPEQPLEHGGELGMLATTPRRRMLTTSFSISASAQLTSENMTSRG